MHRMAAESRLLQPVLHDGAIETGEGIGVEVRRLAVHLTHGKGLVLGLVLEDALFGVIDPGDVGPPNRAREGIAISRPSGSASLVNA